MKKLTNLIFVPLGLILLALGNPLLILKISAYYSKILFGDKYWKFLLIIVKYYLVINNEFYEKCS